MDENQLGKRPVRVKVQCLYLGEGLPSEGALDKLGQHSREEHPRADWRAETKSGFDGVTMSWNRSLGNSFFQSVFVQQAVIIDWTDQ